MAQYNINTHLNFAQNQALGMVLENLASAPSTPVEGQLYYNTTNHDAYKWNGTEWLVLGNMSEQEIKNLFSGVSGISYNATTGAFSADVDDVTIQVGAEGLEVKEGGIKTAELADDSVDKTKVNADVAGTGIAQNVDGSLEVDYDVVGTQLAGTGLTYDADNNVINFTDAPHKENVGNGTDTLFTITHNFGTQDVRVEVFDTADNYAPVGVQANNPTVNTSTVEVNEAPAENQYRVIVTKL